MGSRSRLAIFPISLAKTASDFMLNLIPTLEAAAECVLMVKYIVIGPESSRIIKLIGRTIVEKTSAQIHHVSAIGHRQRTLYVLLNDQHRNALGLEPQDGFHHVLYHLGR